MRIRNGVGLAAILGVVGCGGDNQQAPGGGGRVTLDAQAAVHDSVTVTGKVLTATSHGLTYTLTIPAGAVELPTVITMTPVTGIDGLPVTQLVGAVDLEPQGLVLGRAARLRIAGPHSAPVGTRLIGLGYEGDADSLQALLPQDSAGTISLSISHFSGGGAAFATLGEIQTFLPHGLTSQSRSFVDSLFVLTMLDPRDFLAEQNLMRQWFSVIVLLAVQNAANDVALLRALSEYDAWRGTGTPANLIPDDPLFANERTRFAEAALPRLQQAVSQNNAVCVADRDISFANNVLYWQTVADELGLATVANGLDRSGTIAGLCIHVLITDSSYPDPGQPQQTGTLDLLAGLKFGTDPLLSNQLFIWTLDISGSTADGTTHGNSAPDGSFRRTIVPTGSAPLIVRFEACLFAAEVPYADVCSGGIISRNFSNCRNVLSGDVTVNSAVTLAALATVTEVTGNLRLQGGVGTVDLQCLHRVDGALIVSGASQTPWQSPGIVHLPALDSVGGFAVDFGAVGVFAVELPGLRWSDGGLAVAGPDLQDLVLPTFVTPGAVTIGAPSLHTVTLGDVGALNVVFRGNPALTSVSTGRLTLELAGSLVITSNPSLTSFSVASLSGTETLSLQIQSNGSLRTLGGFPSSTVVSGFFFDLLNGFDESAALAFANRITAAAVCQTQPASQLVVKCYQGPPWH
jgi:hypothetical protein